MPCTRCEDSNLDFKGGFGNLPQASYNIGFIKPQLASLEIRPTISSYIVIISQGWIPIQLISLVIELKNKVDQSRKGQISCPDQA